jgi:two-component system LytT family response regulator
MASGEIYLYPTNEIAISFYHKLMKEIPLTMLLIIAVTFGWRYLSHLYTANEQLRSEFVLVDTRDGKQKIDISTLMLISASGNYVNLVTNTGESYLYRSTMKNMHELLDANQFIRIHRSYIINRKGIKRIASGNHGELKLTLNNGQKSVVSRHYAKQLRKEFNNAIESALLH